MKRTKEQIQKQKKCLEDQKQSRLKQQIKICPGWSIVRFDEFNWAIPPTQERGGSKTDNWYYGRLIDALRAIPHKMLDRGSKNTMEDILSQLQAIKIIIEESCPEKWSDESPYN